MSSKLKSKIRDAPTQIRSEAQRLDIDGADKMRQGSHHATDDFFCEAIVDAETYLYLKAS